jgi:hypothetical protein
MRHPINSLDVRNAVDPLLDIRMRRSFSTALRKRSSWPNARTNVQAVVTQLCARGFPNEMIAAYLRAAVEEEARNAGVERLLIVSGRRTSAALIDRVERWLQGGPADGADS